MHLSFTGSLSPYYLSVSNIWTCVTSYTGIQLVVQGLHIRILWRMFEARLLNIQKLYVYIALKQRVQGFLGGSVLRPIGYDPQSVPD